MILRTHTWVSPGKQEKSVPPIPRTAARKAALALVAAVSMLAAVGAGTASALINPSISPSDPPPVGATLTATMPIWEGSTPDESAWWRCPNNHDQVWTGPWTPMDWNGLGPLGTAVRTHLPNGCKVIATTVRPAATPQLTYTTTTADKGQYLRFAQWARTGQILTPTGDYYLAMSDPVGKVGSLTYNGLVGTRDVLAYYRLDDLANTSILKDSTTHHYDGIYKPGGTAPTVGIVGGGGNKAKIFNGLSSAYAYVNGIKAPDTYTLEIWAKPKFANATTFMDHGGAGALGIDAAGKWTFVAQDATVTAPLAIPPTDLNKWHHIVGVFDFGEMTATLYVDGSSVGSVDVNTVPSGTSTFYLARGRIGTLFKGYLDEAAYYSEVLSPSDVAYDYAAGTH
jgi:hypothetical protein